MEAIKKQNILLMWLVWHFYEMPVFLFQVWMNYLDFAANFFSVPLLLKTFLSPWKKYNWRYPRGFDIVAIMNTFVSNVFSRLVGALLRVFLIIFGIILQLFTALAGLIIFLGWIILPFAVAGGFLFLLTY